jgi:DNA processing protein
MIPQEELLASLALNDLAGFGPVRFRILIETFGGARGALEASSAWATVPGLDLPAESLADLDAARGRAAADAELAQRHGTSILLAHAGSYPAMLRTITNPPPVLYVAGTLSDPARAVALVGSRRCTHYGEKVARMMARDLADAGVVTVSGLARGIDTAVHRASLEAAAPTWAVVGSGLLMTYPPENRGLARDIAAGGGAVISEFPMALKPHPSHFPRRNRIIAGLSSATVVVEGDLTSGALITARLATEEGRDVFAVPGPVTSPVSRAPHLLLRQGAIPAESAGDILEELKWDDGVLSSGDAPTDAGPADEIVSTLSDVPMSKEDLLVRCGLEPGAAAARLLNLELRGLIKSLPGGKLVRA